MSDIYPPIYPPNVGSGATNGPFWTFEAVQERLVEAMTLWWRMPDRERGWMTIRAFWPEIMRHGHFGDGDGMVNHADHDARPRPLPLTRDQVAEMEEASEWLRFIPDRDRKLVALALLHLARGEKRVPWMELRAPLGVQFGADGLRKRYSRAISSIAQALNRAEKLGDRASSPRMAQK